MVTDTVCAESRRNIPGNTLQALLMRYSMLRRTGDLPRKYALSIRGSCFPEPSIHNSRSRLQYASSIILCVADVVTWDDPAS